MSNDINNYTVNLEVSIDIEKMIEVLKDNADKIITAKIKEEPKLSEEERKRKIFLKQREDIKAWHRALNKRDSNGIIAYDNEGNEIRIAKNGIYINGELIQESNK